MRMLQTTLFSAIAILLIMVLPAQSRDLYPDDLTVEVVSDYRGSLREYPAHKNSKWQRTYIETKKDERYRIRVRNNTDRRIGIVIAVDGRNIISGKQSNLKHNEAMYVVNPWQTTEYSGWRTSRNQEHRFYFTNVDSSYADAWGDRSAMGVIAVAAFPEKWRKPRPEFDRPFDRSAPMGSMKRGQHKAPGTGFGEGNWSPSHEVNFVAKHRPFMKKFIKYEWRKTLCRRGIIECHRNRRHEQPRNRFWPEEKDCDRGFAPFPPPVNHLFKQLLPVPW